MIPEIMISETSVEDSLEWIFFFNYLGFFEFCAIKNMKLQDKNALKNERVTF